MPGEKHEREDIWQYVFRGQHHNVEDGTDMLIQLIEELRREKPHRFEQLPEEFPSVRKRWFTRDKKGLHRGHHFRNSDVCLDTNMKTTKKKEFARQVLDFFCVGHEPIEFVSTKTTKA